MSFIKDSCWSDTSNSDRASAQLKMALSYCNDSLVYYKRDNSKTSIFIAIAISALEKALNVH